MTSRTLDPELRTLAEMLAYMRPAGSRTERRFIRDFITTLGARHDAAGNLILRIGAAPVLWSCHTDTVHGRGGMQMVEYADGMAHLPRGSRSTCLGADDTAGVWLMCEMILAQTQGLYVFHRGEEIGGIGSNHIAWRTPALLSGIDCAIALDRRGTSSVITHQGGRCCSDAFAQSLAAQLGGTFAPDDTGTFTDTANYVDTVGECTNLSVGYYSQHTKSECLDLSFLLGLRDRLIALDISALAIERVPGETELLQDDWAHKYFGTAYGSMGGLDYYPNDNRRPRSMAQLVRDYPDEIADLLVEYGYDADGLTHEIYARGGEPR